MEGDRQHRLNIRATRTQGFGPDHHDTHRRSLSDGWWVVIVADGEKRALSLSWAGTLKPCRRSMSIGLLDRTLIIGVCPGVST
jgi:hypothetical protein